MIKYRSKFEQRVHANIKKVVSTTEYEPDTFYFPFKVGKGKCLDCGSPRISRQSSYTPDFKIRDKVYIEAKGNFTPTNRTRLVAFAEEYPDVTIFLLFQRDNWITRRKVSRYSSWATSHGVRFAIGEKPPNEWFESK
jgi:hypothetical protein